MPIPIDARFHDESLRSLKFSMAEYRARLDAVQQLVRDRDLDALVVHSHAQIMYVTGFESASWWAWSILVVPADGDPWLLCDENEATNAAYSCWLPPDRVFVYPFGGSDPVIGDSISASVDLITSLGYSEKRLGLDTAVKISYEMGLTFRMYEALRAGLPEATWVDIDDGIDVVMLIKSEAEIDCFRQSARYSTIGMQALIDAARVGVTDNELGAAVMHALYTAGSEPMVIEPLISVGRHSGMFHTRWRRTMLTPGDAIFSEIGGVYYRYSSPLMRAIVMSPGPDPALREIIEACLESMRIMLDGMRPGVDGGELAAKATEPLRPYGEGYLADGNRGYSLEAGDIIWSAGAGMISERLESVTLEAGQVFHVRAPVRDIGKAGITFSDTVLITESGNEVLTKDIPLDVAIR